METNFAIYPSPLGFIRIEHRASRLSALRILEREPDEFGARDTFCDMVYEQLSEYFRGERRRFDIELDLSGCTPFQVKVYEQLLQIPYGQTSAYKQIAITVGNPNASRAVGGANNRNPIHIIIPCHRVIGANGSLTGYASGVGVKESLLNLESTAGRVLTRSTR
ncbi:MAG: methylated-DNA--[protein]-cysteine S-methyltransferase [Rikenellaceae bacterium]